MKVGDIVRAGRFNRKGKIVAIDGEIVTIEIRAEKKVQHLHYRIEHVKKESV